MSLLRTLINSLLIIDLLKKINDFGTTILVTTHNENVVNTLQKRVITMKHGKIVNDQKNNGIYNLDETPVPKATRAVQTPGHALKPKRKLVQWRMQRTIKNSKKSPKKA